MIAAKYVNPTATPLLPRATTPPYVNVDEVAPYNINPNCCDLANAAGVTLLRPISRDLGLVTPGRR
jgi:hypothetical protein